MIHLPPGSSPLVNMVSLDPGSNRCGVGILTIDLITSQIAESNAFTIMADRGARDTWEVELHGERQGRLQYIEDTLYSVLMFYQPADISSESPFMGRFAAAYGALTEVICAIRRAIARYDRWKSLTLIDPPTVKLAVGAKGNADKDVMKKMVSSLPDLNYKGEVPILLLDEHSIDGLAVGYCRKKFLMG